MSNDPEYQREWYNRNKSKILIRQNATNRRVRKEKQEYVQSLKSLPCTDCGQTYHYSVMDFDHVSGVKIGNIGNMVGTDRASWEDLKAEIAKCELVCANCHRLRTWKRSQCAQKSNA